MRDEFKKQLRGGASPRLIPGMSVADPKRRIIILVGLFLLLLFVASMLKGYSQRPETQEVAGDDAPPSKEMPRTKFHGVPTLDRSFAEVIKDGTPAEQGAWDEKAISYLVLEAQNTPAVVAYRRKLLPITPGNAEMFRTHAKDWRFQFVRFRGEIEYSKDGDYADISHGGSGDIGDVHYARVRLTDGDQPLRVVYVTPTLPIWYDKNTPEIYPPAQEIKDGWVRGRGIFVKNFLDVGPDGREVPAFLVVATTIKRDFKRVPVESLDSIPFQIIQDQVSFLQHEEGRKLLFKNYPKTLFRLLQWATPRAGEAGKALREKEQLKAQSIKEIAAYEAMVSDPDAHRAKYVGALGALVMKPLYVGPEEIEDDKANDAGIDEYITGWLVTDKDRLVEYIAPASFAKTDLKRRARVFFAGYFYKTQGYYARDGTQRLAPFLVLTELREINPPPPDRTVELFVAIGFIAGIALLIFIIVREDKTKQDYRRLRRSAKIES